MNCRLFFQIPLFTLLALAAVACGSDGEDDDGGRATCAAVCAEQNELCGSSDDCSMICSSLAQMNSKSGCDAEYQEALDCLAAAKQCDEDETLCPGESYLACLDDYCAVHPSEPFC
jgi:hypothetical protein